MTLHRNRASTGFTLLELVIVIAIIATIAALVVPVYHRTIQGAQSAACVSNLRQLGAALSAYLGDNGMKMPALQALRTSTADNVPVIDNTLNRYVTTRASSHVPRITRTWPQRPGRATTGMRPWMANPLPS